MDVTYTTLAQGRAAILRPNGALDWSSYQLLIAQAWAIHDINIRHLIVDLHDVTRVSTAGMVGLYAVARLVQEIPPLDFEAGWEAMRALAENGPLLRRLAVVNPCPPMRKALENAPFSDFLAVHADIGAALAALAA